MFVNGGAAGNFRGAGAVRLPLASLGGGTALLAATNSDPDTRNLRTSANAGRPLLRWPAPVAGIKLFLKCDTIDTSPRCDLSTGSRAPSSSSLLLIWLGGLGGRVGIFVGTRACHREAS